MEACRGILWGLHPAEGFYKLMMMNMKPVVTVRIGHDGRKCIKICVITNEGITVLLSVFCRLSVDEDMKSATSLCETVQSRVYS